MSKSYGFRCRTHVPPLDSATVLRDYEARDVFAMRADVPAALRLIDALGGFRTGDVLPALVFLREHAGCDVSVVDEYGREDES